MEKQMHIGVMGALAMEIAPLKEQVQIAQTSIKGRITFYDGLLSGRRVTIAACGVGKVCAAMGVQLMLSLYNPDWVFFVGLAGALQENLEIGDLVFAEEIVQHDVNRPASNKLIGSELHPGRLIYLAEANLLKQAWNIGQELLKVPYPGVFTGKQPKMFTGRILTGDRIVGREETAKRLSHDLHGLCVEMEGAAAAQVCAFNSIPFLLMRCISDHANERSETDFKENAFFACQNLTIAAKEIISKAQL
jgi:adenosylhomocysteine nucleosidase